jgi:hypothetical protein
MKKPPKWNKIYPQGTPQGDEEQRFFVSLIRDKYVFKSVSQLARDARLTKERIEEIISKYAPLNVVIQNPKNEDQWGYWENCEDMVPKPFVSIHEYDRRKRISEFRKK